MKNIFRILFLALVVPMLITSCRNDDHYRDWTTPEASFKLYDTTLGASVLYPTMENNPFILTWDKVAEASEYTVELSATADFKTPAALGKSNVNSLKTTVGALNTALLQAGFVPYQSQKVFIRVKTGTSYSNVISMDVTPYPSASPVITSPTAGSALVLDNANLDGIATTVKWTDYSYATDVVYLVEIAPKGSTTFTTVGSVNNLKQLDVTNKTLNDAAIKAGLQANVAKDVDIRVTATTKSAGGTIVKTSNVVTFKLTPFVSFKNLYFVGDATAAGWSNNNNNQALFRDPVNTNKFYYTGYFKAGGFKLLEVLGQWQPQWGLKNGVVTVNESTTGSDPDTFTIDIAGYYTFTIDIVAKTYTLVPYTENAATYNSIGMIGEFTAWGSEYPLEKSTFDEHQWSAKDVSLPAGQLKFRGNGSWDFNWGPTKALQSVSTISGQGVQGGENILLDNEGSYDIYFNDIDGRYVFVKK